MTCRNLLNSTLWKLHDNGHAKPNAKESQLYGYHATLAIERKVSCLCVFVCVSFMWVTPPCLMAPCCVQRPALSCSLLSHSHTQTNEWAQWGKSQGVPYPNTLYNASGLHLLLSNLKVGHWSASMSLLSLLEVLSSFLSTSPHTLSPSCLLLCNFNSHSKDGLFFYFFLLLSLCSHFFLSTLRLTDVWGAD